MSRHWRALVAGALAALAGLAAATPAPAPVDGAAALREWRFEVRLDDAVIGEHRFSLQPDGEGLRLTSSARFEVRVLGIPFYRYRHEARERWAGGCLVALDADTTTNGRDSRVSARRDGAALQIDGPQGVSALPGCAMSFAYWNPALRRQARLLNPQTGAVESVQFVALGSGEVDVRGTPVRAERWRLAGAESPIELWYGPDGEWLALDASVGGKRLRYRIR